MSNGVPHGELVLFECPRVRRSEYWQFIKLVAPAGAPPGPGQTHWLSQDASDAFCLKCDKMFRFQKGSSNSVRRHMERFHRKELAKYQAQAQTESAALVGALKAGKRGKADHKSRSKRAAAELGDAIDATPSPPATDDAIASRDRRNDQSSAKRSRRAAGQRDGEELFVRWICAGLRPLSTVEDVGLSEFVAFLTGDDDSTPRAFQLPTFDVLKHRLELAVESLRFDAKQVLKRNPGHFSLSTELWSVRDKAAESKYAVISCHTLSEDFTRVTVPLEVLEIRPDNSSIHALVAETLREWGLSLHHVSLALTLPTRKEDDRTQESDESHARTANVRWFRDVLTCLSGDLKRGLSGEPSRLMLESAESSVDTSPPPGRLSSDTREVVLAAIGQVQELARACHRLAAVRRKMMELHRSNSGADGELWVFDDQETAPGELTTWVDWSRFLDGAVAFRPTFDALFTFASTEAGAQQLEPDFASTKPLSARSWLVVEVMAALLHPLQELHDVLSGGESRSPCVASLPFMLQCLTMVKQQLERDELVTEVGDRLAQSQRDADAEVGKKESDSHILAQLEHLRAWVINQVLPRDNAAAVTDLGWCSALDPRCARMRHLSDDERELCKATLVDRAVELYASQLQAPAAASLSETASASSDPLADFDGDMMYGVGRSGPQPAQGLMHRLLYDDDDDVAATEGLPREAEIEHARLYVGNEVAVYLSEHQTRKSRVSCPLEWWRANRDRFPFLAPLARIWLGAVASTGHELQHAMRSEVDRENRRRATPKTTRDMLYVHVAARQQRVFPSPSPSSASSSWVVAAPPASSAQPSPPPFAV